VLSINPGDEVAFSSRYIYSPCAANDWYFNFGDGKLCAEASDASSSGGTYDTYFCSKDTGDTYDFDGAWSNPGAWGVPITTIPTPTGFGTTHPFGQRCQPFCKYARCDDWTGARCVDEPRICGTQQSNDGDCQVGPPYTEDNLRNKSISYADGRVYKTFNTPGTYTVQARALDGNGTDQGACFITVQVAGSPSPTNTPTPAIIIRGRVENEGLITPFQCTSTAYYENNDSVQLYRSNGTLLQSVTTYPGPAGNPQDGFYQFTTPLTTGQSYFVCGVNTSTKIFTHAMADATLTPPVCSSNPNFNGKVCISYPNVSSSKNGRLFIKATTPTPTGIATPTPTRTPTPTPVALQPVLSCGAYDSATNTFTVSGTWSPPNNVTFVMSSHPDYSLPYLNVTGTPPKSYAGVPAGTTVYGRVTSSGVNYFATPLTCTAPTPINPAPYGVMLPMVTITGVSCNLPGWACDESDVRWHSRVNLYADGSLTPFAQPVARALQTTPPPGPPAPGNCVNTFDHGYTVPVPTQLQDNLPHTIVAKVLGIKSDGSLDGTIVPLIPLTPGPQVITCNIPPPATPTPAPWVQLNAGSFQSPYSLFDKIPLAPAPYSGIGFGQTNFITSNGSPQQDAGAVTANGINLQSINPSGAVSVKKWSNSSYVAEGTNISDFIQYIKAKKTYHVISNFSNLSPNNIYVIQNNNNFVIDSTNETALYNAAPIVLLFENSNVSINVASFNPSNAAITILASGLTGGGESIENPGRITFSTDKVITTTANGLFIANEVDTGTTSDQGLQITGNLIAGSLSNGRQWANNNRPSLYVVNNIGQYMKVLNLLSKSTSEWTQLQ
jgi:hypothetical protein